MRRKMTNCIRLFFIIFMIIHLASCDKNDNKQVNIHPDMKVAKWDNTKYADWESSVGLDVYNENSFNTEDENSNKANKILYIENLNDPITLKFNNNGKKRNFIVTVYYDYEQIPFKISETNDYDLHYKFELDDGYEAELLLYLPRDLKMEGNHKLLISFTIGHDINAKDISGQSDWYGMNAVYDIVYDINDVEFIDYHTYEKATKTIDQTYRFTLNEDFHYSILDTNILPHVNKVITIKPGEKLNLMYHASTLGSDAEKILLLATIGFEQVNIDGKKYKLLEIPTGETGIGEIALTAPEQPGFYEVIALAVSNPFAKINDESNFEVYSSVRFTLEVK